MTEVAYRPAPLRPITSPTELREATVRDYARQARRLGVDPDMRLVEKQAVADLELVDAYRRGVDLSPNAKRRRKPPERKRAESALAKPADGVRLKPAGAVEDRDRPALLYQRAHRVSEKWAHAVARIKRIIEGAAAGAATDVFGAVRDAQIPHLALEFARLDANYRLRHRQSRHNPFEGLSDRDAARKFMAMVFDICDRSTGRLGQWWVPK